MLTNASGRLIAALEQASAWARRVSDAARTIAHDIVISVVRTVESVVRRAVDGVTRALRAVINYCLRIERGVADLLAHFLVAIWGARELAAFLGAEVALVIAALVFSPWLWLAAGFWGAVLVLGGVLGSKAGATSTTVNPPALVSSVARVVRLGLRFGSGIAGIALWWYMYEPTLTAATGTSNATPNPSTIAPRDTKPIATISLPHADNVAARPLDVDSSPPLFPAEGMVSVTTSGAPLRAAPSFDAPVIARLASDTVWIADSTHSGIRAPRQAVVARVPMPADSDALWAGPPVGAAVIVQAEGSTGLTVSFMSDTGEALFTVPASILDRRTDGDKWYRVRTRDGLVGYVLAILTGESRR